MRHDTSSKTALDCSRFGIEGSPQKSHSLPTTLRGSSLEVELPQLKQGSSEIQEESPSPIPSPIPSDEEARKASISA